MVGETLKVLDKVGERFGHKFEYTKALAGGCAIDATGACLPQETVDICKKKRRRSSGSCRRLEMGQPAGK